MLMTQIVSMVRSVRLLLTCAALAASHVVAAHTLAADWPSRPLTIVVPYAAGSSLDLRVRQVANRLSPRLGQAIVIDNRPGASASLGTAIVAKAKPDGYTLLACTPTTHGVNSALMAKLPYDALSDFVPIVRFVRTPFIVAVNPARPYKTITELISYARANPGALRYGSGGAGSAFHLVAEAFAQSGRMTLTHIPYKGDGPAMNDVVGGHIDMLMSVPVLLLPQINAGRLRPLATTGERRLSSLPNIPTLAESGIKGAEFYAWGGLCAPARTPVEIVKRLNIESIAIFQEPALKAELEQQGYEIEANTPEEFRAIIVEGMARYQKLARELKLEPQ